jgi:spore germination protein
VIAYPEQVYIAQQGDSLISIAKAHNVTLMQILRNNPFLVDREVIYPGETIVISYPKSNNKIETNGYAYPFIDRETLRKTLPFLTYLSIFNYRVTAEADIIGINDDELIKLAKEYGVAPVMLLSTLSDVGTGNIEVAYRILNNDILVDRYIENILNILITKGYYGVNITFQFLNADNTEIYNRFITKLTNRLNSEGYQVWITLIPKTFYKENEIVFEKINYSTIGKKANSIMILSYSWGYSFGPPVAPSSLAEVMKFLDYTVSLIEPSKILMGLPVIGYDWQLPYEEGVSRANSITNEAAIALANRVGATIQYDVTAQAPYFFYADSAIPPNQHIVWFKDARSIDALTKLVPTYGLQGIGIWNIMKFYSQMWLIINTQFEIEKIPMELPSL